MKVFNQILKRNNHDLLNKWKTQRNLGLLTPFKVEEIVANLRRNELNRIISSPLNHKLTADWESNKIELAANSVKDLTSKKDWNFNISLTPQFYPINNYLRTKVEQEEEVNLPTNNDCLGKRSSFLPRNSKPVIISSLSINLLAIITILALLKRKRKNSEHSLKDCRSNLFKPSKRRCGTTNDKHKSQPQH